MEEEDLLLLHSPQDPESLPELTRSSSKSSSITLDYTSKRSSYHYAPAPFMDHSTRWTDQQHGLYISSLEASFVNELHRSMRLRGWSLQNNMDEIYKSRTLQNSLSMPRPRESLALQDGCQKISLERVAPMLESTADSHVLAESQFGLTSIDRGCNLRESDTNDHGWLCDEKVHARGSSTFINRSQRSLEPFRHELVCSTAEATDQNFNEEEARSSCMPMVKRLKTAAADGLSSDQVVPFGKIYTPDVSTSINSTSEYKGHELLSEPTESYHFPKSDLCYFLKGR